MHLLISCENLENVLKINNVSDIDTNEIFNELRILGRVLKNNQPVVRFIVVLNIIANFFSENLFHNAFHCLQNFIQFVLLAAKIICKTALTSFKNVATFCYPKRAGANM